MKLNLLWLREMKLKFKILKPNVLINKNHLKALKASSVNRFVIKLKKLSKSINKQCLSKSFKAVSLKSIINF